ncbi:MAG: UDP-2,3-diacylglucosamine diphosphatase [Gammaproteobacteria bacterium]
MKHEILFISDLHISLEKPEITRRFVRFLQNRAVRADAVYILGDLFDSWIGDDDTTPPTQTIRGELEKLTAAETTVYFQHGNRDFLLGERFCRETGISLLDEYAVIDLFGVPTLLTHGDLLCTDDLPYQAFRTLSRTPEWQRSVLSKPLFIRLLAARWYRLRSFFHKRKKNQEIMDVNQHTVTETMRKYGCMRLIHGHTHRPGVHSFEIDGQAAQRFVLADWKKESAEVLCWTRAGYRIEPI